MDGRKERVKINKGVKGRNESKKEKEWGRKDGRWKARKKEGKSKN